MAGQESAPPDAGLRDVPLGQIAAPPGSVLAACLALYRERLEGVPPGAFQSMI